MAECTRLVAFDAAHRVPRHASKCRNLHGHRYTAEITAQRLRLTEEGFVVDFGIVKALIGGWIDAAWDHGTILGPEDDEIAEFLVARGHKVFRLPGAPTAENLAAFLLEISRALLVAHSVDVSRVRLWETPNAYADALPGCEEAIEFRAAARAQAAEWRTTCG